MQNRVHGHVKAAENVFLAKAERKMGNLVGDFMRMCDSSQHVRFHCPLLVDMRSNGMRGLFMPKHHYVERNTPLYTIPFKGFVGNATMMTLDDTLPVTLADVEQALEGEEIRAMAPQLHLAMHVSNQIARLPHVLNTRNVDVVEGERIARLETGGLMPYWRLLDDEDWSEQHIQQMYRNALDDWQKKNYDELLLDTGRAVSKLHQHFDCVFKQDLLRRMARVIIARVEHVPNGEHMQSNRVTKSIRAAYRAATKTPKPKVCALVPMLDMLNHSSRPNCDVRFHVDDKTGEPVATVFSLCRIKGEQEVCRHYNFTMDRSNALFRFGFLPFDTVEIPELDPWKEHYEKTLAGRMDPISTAEQQKRQQVEDEVFRLQRVFADAKRGKPQPTK
jgi:hypothetical protein